MKKKPCPFCGSVNLQIQYKVSHGHGGCGYNHLRVACKDCDATKGLSDYGYPTDAAIQKAEEVWNKRV